MMTSHSEHPIIFSASMVRAILTGRKTQTRRILNKQPELLYGITGDKISIIHNSGELYGFDFPCKQSGVANNTRISELGLYGGLRWQNLLADTIQRLREEDFSGLVSVTGSRIRKGIFDCLLMPQEQKSDEISTPFNLHGISRDTKPQDFTDTTSGWDSFKQCPIQSCMGNSLSELGGSKSAWTWDERRKSSNVEIDKQGKRTFTLGFRERFMQSKAGGKSSWNVPERNVLLSSFYKGLRLWVRETFQIVEPWGSVDDEWIGDDIMEIDGRLPNEKPELIGYWWNIIYKATDDICSWWRPAIYMPRWASRINLEITDICVERLQSISEDDVIAEGCPPAAQFEILFSKGDADWTTNFTPPTNPAGKNWFQPLWDEINSKRGFSWESNPWVWVLTFRLVSD